LLSLLVVFLVRIDFFNFSTLKVLHETIVKALLKLFPFTCFLFVIFLFLAIFLKFPGILAFFSLLALNLNLISESLAFSLFSERVDLVYDRTSHILKSSLEVQKELHDLRVKFLFIFVFIAITSVVRARIVLNELERL